MCYNIMCAPFCYTYTLPVLLLLLLGAVCPVLASVRGVFC